MVLVRHDTVRTPRGARDVSGIDAVAEGAPPREGDRIALKGARRALHPRANDDHRASFLAARRHPTAHERRAARSIGRQTPYLTTDRQVARGDPMPSHDRESSSCNGVSRSNLFLESDPEDDLRPAAAAPAAAAASAWGFSAARQRGRGLAVPVVDAHPPRGATRGASEVARFMRRGTSVGPLLRTARRHVRRADGNAQRLLGRLAARPPGALTALFAVAACCSPSAGSGSRSAWPRARVITPSSTSRRRCRVRAAASTARHADRATRPRRRRGRRGSSTASRCRCRCRRRGTAGAGRRPPAPAGPPRPTPGRSMTEPPSCSTTNGSAVNTQRDHPATPGREREAQRPN